MSSANVIQLRQLLAEKFPGLRLNCAGPRSAEKLEPTGLPQLDGPLHGGLPRGALTEFVSADRSSGSATLIHALVTRAAEDRRIVALIDSHDSFEATRLGEDALARLLWARCRTAGEALKAADVVLRDANLPLVLVDLKMARAAQLREIPATVWFRFQRLVEETGAACLVFTPRPMVGPARLRITLRSTVSLEALDDGDFPRQLKLEISDTRQSFERREAGIA